MNPLNQSSKFINRNLISNPINNSDPINPQLSIPDLKWYNKTYKTKKKSLYISKKQFNDKFHLTRELARKELGISNKEMKEYYNKYSIKKWPYRRIESIRVRRIYLQNKLLLNFIEDTRENLTEESSIYQKKKEIIDKELNKLDDIEKEIINKGGECINYKELINSINY